MWSSYALCCALVVAVAACGGDSDGDRGASLSAETALIRSYVNEMNERDVEGAARLRCTEAQMEDQAQRDLFRTEVDRLIDTVGPIEVGRVEASSDRALDALGVGERVRSVVVELSGRGQRGSEPLEMVVLEQGDELRICGVATRSAKGLHLEKPPVVDLGPTRLTVQQLVPTEVGDGYAQVFDAPPPQPPASAYGSWSRAWQADGYGGVNVNASEFRSSQEARDYAEHARDEVLSDTVTSFTAGGGLGLRYLGHAWLWSQPPSVGDHVDQAILLFGDTVVTIKITIAGSDDHELVQAVAQSVVDANA